MRYGRHIQFIMFLCSVLLAGCIENDIPYPVIKGTIDEIETNSFVSATINKNAREVTLLVDDTADLRDMQITKLVVSEGTSIVADSLACMDFTNFPDSGFVSLDTLPATANTRINLASPVHFTLKTYQDYLWKITAKRNIQRAFGLKGPNGEDVQVSTPVVDESTKEVIIYVEKGTDLSRLQVTQFRLGSSIAQTEPDIVGQTVDFRRPKEFRVSLFGEEETWKVNVVYYYGSSLTLSVWSKRAYLIGDAAAGTAISVQYRKEGEEEWDQVFDDEITFADGSFTAAMRHLSPATTYEYQATIGTQAQEIRTFTTDEAPQLPNSGFEDWHQNGKIWSVYPLGGEMFWDSGNVGSATIGKNITNYDDAVVHGGKYSARLGSEWVVIKFAAGNIFTGEFVALDSNSSDGILDFGRPFTARPSILKGWFRYTSAVINRVSADDPIEDAQKGMNDKAYIYIALGDWDRPVRIRTMREARQLFDKEDSHIIAYQELVVDKTVSDWTEFKLVLDYRSLTRKPTHIVVVASASKYGDYFTGGEGSTLWLDDLELVYQ